jgi:hypothetical protein
VTDRTEPLSKPRWTAPLEKTERDKAKRAAAAAWDHGIKAARLENEQAGFAIGVKETRMWALRSSDTNHLDATPNLADLILIDDDVAFEETIARIRAERVARHGPPKSHSLESHLLTVLAKDSTVTARIAGALGDGVVTDPEVPGLEHALTESGQAREVALGMLRRRSRR